MKKFVFVTKEGYTFSGSERFEPDVENLQVVGFVEARNKKEAFAKLLAENGWLMETGFNELDCIEVKEFPYEGTKFYLDEVRNKLGS